MRRFSLRLRRLRYQLPYQFSAEVVNRSIVGRDGVVGMAGDWLKPVYHEIQRTFLAEGYLQIDETPIKYLGPGNGTTKQGYLWVCKQPQGSVVFQWHTSRSAD